MTKANPLDLKWPFGIAGIGILVLLRARTMGEGGEGSLLWAGAFWLDLSLGPLALLMIHRLTGGVWGEAARPVLRAAAGALPVAAVPFLVLLGALDGLFPWTAPADTLPEAVRAKAVWLDADLFRLRFIAYLLIWLVLVWRFAYARTRPGGGAAAGGLILHALAVTFFAFDWLMSLEPEWFSTIFGMLVGSGQLVAGAALAVLGTTWLKPWASFNGVGGPRHDLGNLLMGFLLVWIYLAFSQYLIIWSADLPHETGWYLHRAAHGWAATVVAVVALKFVLPFAALVPRTVKDSPDWLGRIALVVLLAHLLDLWWLAMPALRPAAWALAWSDLGAIAAVGGLWVGVFLLLLRRAAQRGPAPAAEAAT